MKKLIALFCISAFFTVYLHAQQQVTLESCFRQATENYPLAAQSGIIQQVSDEQIKKINAAWQPQAMLNMQATYQSDVTHVPISFPGVEIPVLSKDQYKATIDVTQMIYDGGISKQQRELSAAGAGVESEKVSVEIFKLHDKVSQLYFSILLAEKNIELVKNYQSDLLSQKKKIIAGKQYGVSSEFQQNIIEAEILKSDQKLIEVSSARSAAIEMLSLLTGTKLNDGDSFAAPVYNVMLNDTTNLRPELQLISLQQDFVSKQMHFAEAATLPKLGLFLQGGYGKPGLNFLDDAFAFYYIGGIKLSYPLWTGNTKKYDASIYNLNNTTINLNRNAFLQQSEIQESQYQSDMKKFGALIEKDEAIIELKVKIKEGAAAQVESGTMSTEDYITYLNDETEARINMATHQVQLLSAQTNYLITLGKIQ